MNQPVTVEDNFKAPASKIWKALTDKEEMKKWYFDLSEFRPEKGFEFSFSGKGHKGENYLHLCRITEVIPEKKLQYSWEYENYPGKSIVTFEIMDDGKSRKVKLQHEGLDTFPQDNPDFDRKSFEAGWTELITKSLKKYFGEN